MIRSQLALDALQAPGPASPTAGAAHAASRATTAAAHPRRRPSSINISEWFGPTIQGEGRNAGQLASFLRLSGCNLSCSWCDSAYTWNWARFNKAEEVHRMELSAVVEAIDALPGRLVVTGGEPLVQAHALAELLPMLRPRPFDLETNGTRPLRGTEGMWATISCSPKVIPSAEQGPLAHVLDPVVLATSDLKFVVHDQADLDAVLAFAQEHSIESSRVWLMPEGISVAEIDDKLPWVMEAAVAHQMNVSSRLHIYAWHDQRGH